MGRGPNATMSFTYCMARAESNDGGGPVSGESAASGAEAALSAGAAASAAFCVEQATQLRRHISPIILTTLMLPFSLAAPSFAWDGPPTRSQYSANTAPPWERQKCTCSECLS